jgi:hypothetical protein
MAEPVHATAAVTVAAPAQYVWRRLTDIGSWSEWYPELRNVVVTDGSGGMGTRFTFKTGPVSIEAVVDEWEEATLFGFTGTSRGADAVYRFSFIALDDSTTRVDGEQSMQGLAVRTMRPMLQKIADTSLVAWLQALRTRTEQDAG